MTQHSRYVIELAGAAAGLVVAEDRRYRFFASDTRSAPLERKLFRSLQDAEESCRRLTGPARRRLCRAA